MAVNRLEAENNKSSFIWPFGPKSLSKELVIEYNYKTEIMLSDALNV